MLMDRTREVFGHVPCVKVPAHRCHHNLPESGRGGHGLLQPRQLAPEKDIQQEGHGERVVVIQAVHVQSDRRLAAVV